jgi:hypothetical protein
MCCIDRCTSKGIIVFAICSVIVIILFTKLYVSVPNDPFNTYKSILRSHSYIDANCSYAINWSAKCEDDIDLSIYRNRIATTVTINKNMTNIPNTTNTTKNRRRKVTTRSTVATSSTTEHIVVTGYIPSTRCTCTATVMTDIYDTPITLYGSPSKVNTFYTDCKIFIYQVIFLPFEENKYPNKCIVSQDPNYLEGLLVNYPNENYAMNYTIACIAIFSIYGFGLLCLCIFSIKSYLEKVFSYCFTIFHMIGTFFTTISHNQPNHQPTYQPIICRPINYQPIEELELDELPSYGDIHFISYDPPSYVSLPPQYSQ